MRPTIAAAVYARVSREFKGIEKVSVEQQVTDAIAAAKKAGLTVDDRHVLEDHNLSGELPPRQFATGHRQFRPALTRLVEAVEQGEVKAIVVRKRDRLFRSTMLALQFYDLLRRHGCRLVATHEALPEADEASGQLTVTILAAMAEFQLRQMKEVAKATKAHARAKGLKLGPVKSLGYLDGGRNEVIVDPKTAPVVREIFRRFIDGGTTGQICAWLEAEHPKKVLLAHIGRKDEDGKWHPRVGCAGRWHQGPIDKLIADPRYIGQRVVNGMLESHPLYPGIIEPEVFWAAQRIIKARRGGYHRSNQHTRHVLTGFLRCGQCGYNLHAYCRSSGVSMFYCTSPKHKGRQVTLTEPLWLEWVASFTPRSFMLPAPSGEAAMLRLKLERIQQNIHALTTRVAAGDESADVFAEAIKQAQKQRAEVEKALDGMPAESSKVEFHDWGKLTFDEQRELLQATLLHVDVFSDRIVAHRPNPLPDIPEQEGEPGAGVTETFPLMKRHNRRVQHVKATNCLTPRLLSAQEAYAVRTTKSGVNWQGWVSKDFFYINPALQRAFGEPIGPFPFPEELDGWSMIPLTNRRRPAKG